MTIEQTYQVLEQVRKHSDTMPTFFSTFSELDLDSLDRVEAIFDCEKVFNVTVEDHEIENIHSVPELIKLLNSKIK